MKCNLPNFLIVGAAKSGTSSLHNYLNQHPEIFLPSFNEMGMKVKEPRFLIKDLVQHRLNSGIWEFKQYQDLFANTKKYKAIGEATVLYLYYYQHAIQKIKYYLSSDVKIIIMLRNPIDRAYSAYLYASRTFQENKTFEEALTYSIERYNEDDTLSPMILYKELGMYYKMVKAYIDNFKDVHIILYDDFISQTEIEVQRVFEFLNVSIVNSIDTSKVINAGGKQWNSRMMKDLLMKEGLLKSFSRAVMPKYIRANIKRFLTNVFTSRAYAITDSTRKRLLNLYKKDIQLLETLINKDLSKWM